MPVCVRVKLPDGRLEYHLGLRFSAAYPTIAEFYATMYCGQKPVLVHATCDDENPAQPCYYTFKCGDKKLYVDVWYVDP